METHVTDQKNKRGFRGQSTLEFALILPVVLLLMISMIEVSRLVFTWAMVTTASREAVRTGSTLLYYTDCTTIRNSALNAGVFVGMTAGDISISYDHGPGTSSYASCAIVNPSDVVSGDRVVVSSTAYYTPGGGFVPLPIPPVTVSSTAARTIAKGMSVP